MVGEVYERLTFTNDHRGMAPSLLMFVVVGMASVFGLILGLTEPKRSVSEMRGGVPGSGLQSALAGLGDLL